jgi:predicted nucleotidyltransferase
MNVLNENIIKEFGNIFSKRENISAVYIFGSVAKGHSGKLSDVDFAILYEPNFSYDRHTFNDELMMSYELELILRKHNLSYQVDIVNLNKVGLVFQHNVVSSGKVIYESSRPSRIKFEANLISYYCDFKPTLDFMNKYYNKGRLKRLGIK